MSASTPTWAKCEFCGGTNEAERLRAVMVYGEEERVCEACYRYDKHEELVRRIAELETKVKEQREEMAGLPCQDQRGVVAYWDPKGIPVMRLVYCGTCPPCLTRKELGR